MKISEKRLGVTKPIEVKQTVKNSRKIDELQLALLKSQDVDEKTTPVETVQSALDVTNKVRDFLINFYKLNKKQIELLDDLTMEDMGNVFQDSVFRFQGVSEEDIANYHKEEANEDTDPKKD